MTETGELILAWLQETYPNMGWRLSSHSTKDSQPIEWFDALIPDPLGSTKGLNVQLEIYKLSVTAFVKTRHKSKVRSVELHDPTSIDGLKELVDHVIKVCTMPASFTKFV